MGVRYGFFLSIGLFEANVYLGFPPALFWLTCLLPTAAAPLAVSRFIALEMQGKGLMTVLEGTYPLLGLWMMQLLDIALYAFLAWYFEQVWGTAPPPPRNHGCDSM